MGLVSTFGALGCAPDTGSLTGAWFGVLGTGQSLSVGGAGMPALSTVQPWNNLRLVDPDFTGDLNAAAPASAHVDWLVEPIRNYNSAFPPGPGYPNNIVGETPHSAMANQLTRFAVAAGQSDYVTLHSVVGEGGESIDVIKKNGSGNSYAAALYEARAFKRLADQDNKKFSYGAILLTHGEADWNNAGYEGQVRQLWSDYNEDLRAITGQASAIPMIVSQQGTLPIDSGYSVATLAEWRLGVDYPGEILCAGPKYQYEYAVDHIHLTANAYRSLGEKYAQVYWRAVVEGREWRPLQPRAVSRAGDRIVLSFDVPVLPLQWDDHIAPPHQRANLQWAKGRGFEVACASGPLTILSVEITGPEEVTLRMSDPPPPGTEIIVAYATSQDVVGLTGGTADARRGQLRDSDVTVGYDVDEVRCLATANSSVVTATGQDGGFSRRSLHDVARSSGLAVDTVIVAKESDRIASLSAPWKGSTGEALIAFSNDLHNYCVQFALSVE